MEKNSVTSAKSAKKAKSPSAKIAKKNEKKQKKLEKKAEKMERKDIKAAYTKALKKQGTEKMLAVIMIVLTIIPIAAEFIVDQIDSKKAGGTNNKEA